MLKKTSIIASVLITIGLVIYLYDVTIATIIFYIGISISFIGVGRSTHSARKKGIPFFRNLNSLSIASITCLIAGGPLGMLAKIHEWSLLLRLIPATFTLLGGIGILLLLIIQIRSQCKKKPIQEVS